MWIGTPLWQISLRVTIVRQREYCLWLHVLESQSIWLAVKCTPVHAPSGWWRPERIFSLVKKLISQDIEQDERKTSSDLWLPPLLIANDTKDRVKRKQWPSLGGRRSIENKSTHYHIFTKVSIPKKPIHKDIFCCNLSLERGKDSHHSFSRLHRDSGDWPGKNSCLLLAPGRAARISRLQLPSRLSSLQPGKSPTLGTQPVGEENFSHLSSRFFGLTTKLT